MAVPLQYDISVTGRQNVDRALSGIERRMAQHNATMSRQLGGTTSARQGRAPTSAASQADREAKTAANYWQRAHQRSVDHRIRQDQKAHAERMRQIAREEAAQKRAADSLDRQRSRALLAQHKETERARIRQEKQNARDAKIAHADRMRFAGTAFGTVGSSVGGTLRAVGGLGATALSIGGSFAMAGAVGAQLQDSRRAAMLANQAGDPSIKGELLREAQGVKGFATGEALGSIEQFITKTGDLGAARSAMPMLSELSLAYGANFEEMGAAAGQAFNVIRDEIKDPIKQMEALRDVMSTMAAQGTLGAVEIKDLTRELAGLGAATRSFEGGPVQLLKTMGAMSQAAVARGGAASAAEATTAVSRFAADVVKGPAQQQFLAMGVDVFSDKSRTKLKDPREIMASIMEKTGGDMTKIEQILNVESAKALRGFSPLFIEAERANAALPKEQQKKKGVAGREAMMAEFDKFMDASATQQDMAARVASIMDEPAMKFQQVVKDFNTAAGSALLPSLIQLIPKFQELVPLVDQAVRVFAKLAEKLINNPLAGIGAIIAAKVAMDIAAAGIGSAARAAFERALGGAFGGGGGTGGAPAPAGGGMGGALSLGASLGLAAGTVILTAGIVNFEAKEAALDQLGALEVAARNAKTPEEVEAIKRQAIKIEEQNQPGWGEAIMGALGSVFSGDMLPYYLKDADELAADANRGSESVTGRAAFDKSVDTMIRNINDQWSRTAKEQAEAARAQKEAAEALKAAGPNRGPTPSPVKS